MAAKDGDDEGGDSFAARLVTKIVDNLQLNITNIHIIFEDRVTCADMPYRLGVSIKGAT